MLTIEGAGVHFKRAFGFQHSLSLIRFCFFISFTRGTRRKTGVAFRGIRTWD